MYENFENVNENLQPLTVLFSETSIELLSGKSVFKTVILIHVF